MSDHSAIELVQVSKAYPRGETALHPTSLEVGSGEFFSLLGPSGCGKSTTLRLIGGFEQVTSGVVRLDGVDVTKTSPDRRNVNMVFQNYALFPHLDVAGNVAFGLRFRRISKSERRRRVGEALELVQLGGFAHRRPSALSGGQQQRVALARALVNEPHALLLDEPLAALDLKLRQSMQLELKRIQRDVGITFVFVTHDQGEALSLSDRIAVMNEGRIVQLGSPQDLYEQPRSRFVANFIGTSNLIEITGATGAERTLHREDGGRIQLPTEASMGGSFTLAIRPECVCVSRSEPDAASRLPVVVQDIDYAGMSTTVLAVARTGEHLRATLSSRSREVGELRPGDSFWMGWDIEDGRFLPQEFPETS